MDTPGRMTGMRRRLDRELTRPMVLLSMLFLFLLAGALPQLELEQHMIHQALVDAAGIGLQILWPVFLIEFIVRRRWIERGLGTWPRIAGQLLVCVAPPLRLLVSPLTAQRCVYLPGLGWARVGRSLYRNLERGFSTPMIVIALMILPALALEFLWRKELLEWPALSLTVDISTRLIWLAFAVELLFMLAATRDKISYCITHWLDVVIVLFPLVAFLRVLQVIRVAEMGRLVQMSRVYRVRALSLRGWRALLLLKGLEKYSLFVAEHRVAHLRKSLQKKLHDVDDLRCHIEELERHLDCCRAEKASRRDTEAQSRKLKAESGSTEGSVPPAQEFHQ